MKVPPGRKAPEAQPKGTPTKKSPSLCYSNPPTNNSQCPDCGASFNVLNEYLFSNGYERELAVSILNNCEGCREHFEHLLPLYSRLEVETMRGDK